MKRRRCTCAGFVLALSSTAATAQLMPNVENGIAVVAAGAQIPPGVSFYYAKAPDKATGKKQKMLFVRYASVNRIQPIEVQVVRLQPENLGEDQEEPTDVCIVDSGRPRPYDPADVGVTGGYDSISRPTFMMQ